MTDIGNTTALNNTLSYPEWLRTFNGAMTTIILTVGIIANLLTIVALSRISKLRNVATYFIISLSVADLLYCSLVLPFTAMRFLDVVWYDNEFLCKFVPWIGYVSVGVTSLSLFMVTVNRYVKIAFYQIHDRIYQKTKIYWMIGLCWFVSACTPLPALFGIWGSIGFDSRMGMCDIIDDKRGHTSKPAIVIVQFVLPCLAIIFCYAGILCVVKKSQRRLSRHSSKTNVDVRRKRAELKRTKMIFVIFITFLACYLPVLIIKSIDGELKYPGLRTAGYMLFYISSCINPLIYVIMNTSYRTAYYNVLTCMIKSEDKLPGDTESNMTNTTSLKRPQLSRIPSGANL